MLSTPSFPLGRTLLTLIQCSARIPNMLKIRLQRVGRVHEPSFRLVLTESKNSTKSGKFLEILGNYDARHAETSKFKSDKITYWMSKGAQVSPTVHNLLISKKIIEGKKVNKLPLKKAIVKEVQIIADQTPTVAEETEEKEVETIPAPEIETPIA